MYLFITFQKLETFSSKLEERVGDLPQSSVVDAAYAYDATAVLLKTWFSLSTAEKDLTDLSFSQTFTTKLSSSRVEALSVRIFKRSNLEKLK